MHGGGGGGGGRGNKKNISKRRLPIFLPSMLSVKTVSYSLGNTNREDLN